MNFALIALNQTITMFLIILVGIIAYKTNIIKKETNSALSSVVLNIVNPALIFMSYQIDFDIRLLKGLLITTVLSGLSFLVAIIISYVIIIKKNNESFNIERISIIFSNCGFMGIPLVNALIGEMGVFYLATYITVFNILLWTLGVMLVTGRSDLKSAGRALLSPCIIAVFAGIICFIANIRLYENISAAAEFVASMNTPLAMMVAGVTIAQTNILNALKKLRIYLITFVKLLVVPIAVVFMLIPFKLLNIETDIIITVIIATACPTAASGTLFALRYGGDALYASEIFGVTTLLSAATIPGIMLVAKCFY